MEARGAFLKSILLLYLTDLPVECETPDLLRTSKKLANEHRDDAGVHNDELANQRQVGVASQQQTHATEKGTRHGMHQITQRVASAGTASIGRWSHTGYGARSPHTQVRHNDWWWRPQLTSIKTLAGCDEGSKSLSK